MRVGIICMSDKGSKGEREDISTGVIIKCVEAFGYEVKTSIIIPDEEKLIEENLLKFVASGEIDLLLTTGGTGFSPRDVTPEATLRVIERLTPGIPEAMRAFSLKITNRGMLSRGVAGIRENTLIINLPGSPKAVKELLDYILDPVHHGLEILLKQTSDCARK
ncbi:MAG: MogA/MoaB family molybdenum cofactor biosynthesis protein [Psychrilyobacter sp.]|nr:MogA/MoaB family molybdenum cofactor biosynthesis protein [Psychrilyobacter sp.]